MLRRFASGSLVASILVALAAMAVLVLPVAGFQRFSAVLAVWCFVPFIWGLWAMITPNTWIPKRLPLWGAVLGVIASVFAMFVLNMPARIFGQPVTMTFRYAAAVVMIVFYYCMWMFVAMTYKNLLTTETTTPPAKSMGKAA